MANFIDKDQIQKDPENKKELASTIKISKRGSSVLETQNVRLELVQCLCLNRSQLNNQKSGLPLAQDSLKWCSNKATSGTNCNA